MNKLLVEGARLAVGVLGIAAALVWLSGGCGERIEPGELPDERHPVEGEIAAVESVTGPVSEAVSGTLISARQTTISSKILARIESVKVSAGERTRLLIPGSAVIRVGQLQFVTAVDAEGRAGRRLVTTGRERDGRVEVLSGLAAGERVLSRAGP
jgi:hypothetical protein